MRFVATLATAREAEGGAEGDEFVEELLWRLCALSGAASPAVRFRSCQLVALILASLSNDAELTDDLYEGLTEAMLKRLRDKGPAARVEAARALARLQVRPAAAWEMRRPRLTEPRSRPATTTTTPPTRPPRACSRCCAATRTRRCARR